jgi:D-glycero-beta-D-manno-heptose 1-phosphate adenylyltransferase
VVNFVTVFPEVRATRAIELIRPAVYVKGGDYTPETLDPEERDALDRIGSEIQIIPFEAGYSTSRLIKRLGMPSA